MGRAKEIAKKIRESANINMDVDSTNYSQGIKILKTASNDDHTHSFSIRTEEVLTEVLEELNFRQDGIDSLVEEFHSLRTRFDIKRLERFIVVYNTI